MSFNFFRKALPTTASFLFACGAAAFNVTDDSSAAVSNATDPSSAASENNPSALTIGFMALGGLLIATATIFKICDYRDKLKKADSSNQVRTIRGDTPRP